MKDNNGKWEKDFKNILDNSDDGFDDSELDSSVDRVKDSLFDRIDAEDNQPMVPHKTKKRRGFNFKKGIAIAAAVVGGIFVLAAVIPESPLVQAFRFNSRETLQEVFDPEVDASGQKVKLYSSPEEIEKEMGIDIPILGWLPEGSGEGEYSAVLGTDNYVHAVDYYFANESTGDAIEVNCMYFGNDKAPGQMQSEDDAHTLTTIGDYDVVISNTEPYEASFFYKNSFLVSIVSTISRTDIIKVIENIE